MSAVQPIAPTNVEIQEIDATPTEPRLEQPKQVSTLVNESAIFSLSKTIYSWQPAGLRITLKIPSLSNNVDPLFVIRANPMLLSPRFLQLLYPNLAEPAGSELGGYFQQNLISAFTPNVNNPGVVFTWYGEPAFIALLSLIYRKWCGSISLMVRTTAAFTNFGNIPMAPIFGAIDPPQKSAIQFPTSPDTSPKVIQYGSTSYVSSLKNSFVPTDVSSSRHFEINLPYRYPTPWFDQFQYLNDALPVTTKTSTNNVLTSFRQVNARHNFFSCINLNEIGSTVASSGNEIVFEVFIKAGEDFMFSDRHLVPNFWDSWFSSSGSPSNWVVYPRTTTMPDNYDPNYSFMLTGPDA